MMRFFAYVVVICCVSAAAAECVNCKQNILSFARGGVCANENNNSPYCIDECPRVCGGQCSPSSDINNCGACGSICQRPNLVPTCSSGVCQGTCVEGFGNCNNDFQDGCEISFSDSASNCGSCGNNCARPNLSPVCQSGLCSGSCNSGFANCNSNLQDGCEINTNTDATNCGACGTSCARPNLSASCSSGTCGGSCNAGFANCNANLVDGCEINTNTDTANCGACGTSCTRPNLSASCSSGTCGGTCNAGFGNCNANLVDGCEVNLNTNANNCGLCGRVCAGPNVASGACNAGSCTGTCSAGFGNCNGIFADGCEVNLQTSASNCGACGVQCSAGQTCSNGQCIGGGSVQGFTGTAGPSFAGYSQCVGVLDKANVDDLPDNTWANLCKVPGTSRVIVACGVSPQSVRWIEVNQNVFNTGVGYPSTGLIVNSNFALAGNQIYASPNPGSGTSWWVTGNGCDESSPNLTINNGCPWDASSCFGQNLTGDRYLFVYVK